MVWAAALPIAAGVASSWYNSKQAGKNADANRALAAGISDEWLKINMPDLSPVEYEAFRDTFTPQMAQDSLMGNVETDPRLSGAQYAALDQLGELSQGGLNLQDKADLADIQGGVARQDAGRQAAIMQGMAERGMGGSGMELAQRLQSQSSGADRAAGDSRAVAAQAQQRALDAIMRRGQLGGDMRTQQFGEDSSKARAQDSINMYNTGMLNEEQRNTQSINNMNTGVSHMNAEQANEIEQQKYDNSVRRVQGQAGNANSMMGINNQATKGKMDYISNLGSAAAKGLASYGSNNVDPGAAAKGLTSYGSDPVAGAPLSYQGPPTQADAESVYRKRKQWK